MTHPADFRSLCAEMCRIWSKTTNPDDLYENLPPLIDRARAALAAPQQGAPDFVPFPENEEQAAGMALLGMEWLRQHAPHRLRGVHQRRPQQGAPSYGEIECLAIECGLEAEESDQDDLGLTAMFWQCSNSRLLDFAYQVLDRYGAQAVPVAVAERPWERDGWCDERGGFWAEHISRSDIASWRYTTAADLGGWAVRCLPHWALPLPEAQP